LKIDSIPWAGHRFFSSPIEIKVGIPQGTVIAPLLFNLHLRPAYPPHTLTSYLADYKAILTTSPDPILASSYTQDHLNTLESWYKS